MDEKKLVAQVIAGNESAFRVLVGKYERLVSYMVAKAVREDLDREEICQDVFVRVYEKLTTFNFESKLSTWIATIAFRSAVTFAKKRKMNLVDIETAFVNVGDLENDYEKEDLGNYIATLIDQLPVNYKLVLTLFYMEGFSYPEIVEVTGMPEGTVKNYIHRARTKLKELIKQQGKKEFEWIR